MVVAANSFNWRVVVTIALLWVPTAFTIVLRLTWLNLPARIPSHWSGSGPADQFSDSMTTWVICLLVAIAAAAVGVAVVALGQDILPLRRSIAVGVCAAVAGLAVTVWPAFTLSAIAAGGLKGDQGNTMVLLLAGLVWGGLVFLSAGPLVGLGSQLNRRSAARESTRPIR